MPLKKFLAKNTLNSKVNNWAIEISPFRITFEYIKGIKNTLADTMSQMIDIDPQVQPEPEARRDMNLVITPLIHCPLLKYMISKHP